MKLSDVVKIKFTDTYQLIYNNKVLFSHTNLEYVAALIGIYKPTNKELIVDKELTYLIKDLNTVADNYDKNNCILDVKVSPEYKGFNAIIELSTYDNEVSWKATAIHPEHLNWYANFDSNSYEEAIEEMKIVVDLILDVD